MAEYNPIEISNFPEVTDILSTDKIIVFEQVNDELSPRLYDMFDLSAIAVFPENMDDIKNKAEEIKTAINDAITYIKKTFVSIADAKNTYGAIAEMNAIMEKFETTLSFKDTISAKADLEYLDNLANRIKANYNNVKYGLGVDSWDNGKGRGYKRLLVAKAGVKTE